MCAITVRQQGGPIMTSEDRAEQDSLRRLRRLAQLRRDVDEAARVAAAYARLELQLHFEPIPVTPRRQA
jgi:hypothetical protein